MKTETNKRTNYANQKVMFLLSRALSTCVFFSSLFYVCSVRVSISGDNEIHMKWQDDNVADWSQSRMNTTNTGKKVKQITIKKIYENKEEKKIVFLCVMYMAKIKV